MIDNGIYVDGGKIVNNNIKGSLEIRSATLKNNTITNASINFDSSGINFNILSFSILS